MDELIRVKNTNYARYEELLMKRDKIKKEAFQYEREYVRTFGEKILKIFEVKLSCIRKKKAIQFCQAILNCGKTVDPVALQEYLKKEMAEYQEQLDAMIKDHEAAKDTSKISQFELLKVKKIYRKMAKQLHPDINPMTEENEDLFDLWQRIVIAYNCNDVKALEELEVMATLLLENLLTDGLEVEIPNIEDKILEVEAEIEEIRSKDPYQYKYLLNDPESVEEKQASLDAEFADYKEYEAQLDEIMNELIESGVTFTWQMN